MEGAPYVSPAHAEDAPEHASPGGDLSFVDFLPPCVRAGTFTNTAKFEPFSILVDYANEWLRENPSWEAKTCESVEFKTKRAGIDIEKMTYCEHGQCRTYYTRCLRLWIVPRSDQTRPVQQLAYLNLVPNQVESGGLFARTTYETLDQLISRYNSQTRAQPAPGRLLAIQSQEMKTSGFGFDPERSYWYEDGTATRNFLLIIRLFFEVGPPISEEIGLADFVPRVTGPKAWFSSQKYESFASVVAQANDWCSRQSNVRLCNIQTLEMKCTAGHGVDTQEMSYAELSEAVMCYVRILRIAYIKEPTPGGAGNEARQAAQRPPLNLQCKTFVPVQLTRREFPPEFETLSQTKRRVEAWARLTGARVVSCETPAMRLSWTGDPLKYIERGYTKHSGERNEHWILVPRLYLDGPYQEPPPGEMPPVRQVRGIPGCSLH